MGAKTYKMTIPLLKKLCDFFAIDRASCHSKDVLVDTLLDFLGEPSEDKLKGGKRAKSSSKDNGKKKGKAKTKDDDEEEPDDDEDEDYDDVGDDKVDTPEGGMPTDDRLRKWVRAYVRCHNMKTSTIKHALVIAGEKFGVDLAEQKTRLKEMLTEEM